jgi:hypothetical protein
MGEVDHDTSFDRNRLVRKPRAHGTFRLQALTVADMELRHRAFRWVGMGRDHGNGAYGLVSAYPAALPCVESW